MNMYLRVTAALLLLGTGISFGQTQELEPAPKKKAATTVQKSAAPPEPQLDPHAGRGKLFVKDDHWDFGHVSQNSRVSHRFTLQNIGDDTLFITRIKPT